MSSSKALKVLGNNKSAQRLTASKVCPGFFFPAGVPLLSVLNALRHQRCVQREDKANTVARAMCSTPYGIKGVSSRVEPLTFTPAPAVLNALRHQRCVQFPDRAIMNLPNKCSTPYGIKGVSRRGRTSGNPTTTMCSTPYGIKGVSSL